jgi:hypothetical protein
VSIFDPLQSFRNTWPAKHPLSESSALLNNQTQISFPVLAPVESPLRFALLRAWLQRCDEHGCKDGKLSEVFPTNLLDVGDPSVSDYKPNILRLVSGSPDIGKYIALSHCWGEPQPHELQPDGTRRYCTTRSNFDDRQKGFSATGLPLTFLHAIEVARGLGVQYLWIDSLCIIQGETGNWKQESERMQDVYTSAYCTVAATSAVDSNSGFLKRNINTNSEYLYVQDDLGRTVHVCSDLANFDRDVEGALLNTRAWVMQERFLSSRTIHFGANQMYWECGKGVYCEDLTQLTR